MSTQTIHLVVGARLQIERPLDGATTQRCAELIGYRPGQSLLVTELDLPPGQEPLKTGELLVVRTDNGDTTYAFRSSVLKLCAEPYPYTHLSYPTGVEAVMLRRTQRVTLDCPMFGLTLRDGERNVPVTVADISVAGARLIAAERLGTANERLSIDLQLVPGSCPVSLPCLIRYVNDQAADPMFHHGVEFIGLDSGARLFITRHIAEHLTRSRGNRLPSSASQP